MTPVRLAVIGCGYWGPNLIRNFVAIPDCDLVGVADLRPERLDHIQRLYPSAHVTEDYHELFAMGLDAVVVATPPASHFPITQEALQHGLHALVEKPLTLSASQAQALVDLADECGLKLMVGHTFEYNPAVRKAKEIIDSGELGKVYYIDAVRVNLGLFQNDLNVIWDLAPHDISIARYLLGQDPLAVSASGGDFIFHNKHDVAYITLHFADGIMAHIQVSWLNPNKVRRTTIVGSKKMLVYDDVEPLEKIRVYDKGVERPPYTDTFDDFRCSYRYGDIVTPYISGAEPLRTQCQHFIDCILDHERQPQSDGRVGLRVVQILEAADRSLLNGGTLQPIDPEAAKALGLPFGQADSRRIGGALVGIEPEVRPAAGLYEAQP